uniref:Major facilitator superfamily (MFS) profile domain-containing protein n=1 Tax=Pseudo-nitzschia australis TaxID=44445 RepID=A0A7S4AM18_9STRA
MRNGKVRVPHSCGKAPQDQHDVDADADADIVSPDISSTSRGNNYDDDDDDTERRIRHRRHLWSTIGLCGSAFSMFYLIMNVFPYSGFMALHLLNGKEQDQDRAQKHAHSSSSDYYYYTAATIGPYAGILVSSFRLGRIPTAIAWGRCADVYGRKFALVVGLVAMILGNLLFGLAPTFVSAVVIRFVTGLLNGTMVVVRTAISEISRGDSRLESRGVAMMSSMSGYGMLIGPAIGGLLSEPIRQHPEYFRLRNDNNNDNDNDGDTTATLLFGRNTLEDYPFLLPNLVGSFVAFLSLVIVIARVEETLPEDQRRDWRCFPMDMVRWMETHIVYVFMCVCWRQNAIQQLPLPFSNNHLGTEIVGCSSSKPTVTSTTTSINENTPLVPLTTSNCGCTEGSYEDKGTTIIVTTGEKNNAGILRSFFSTTSTVRYFFYSMWCYAFTSLASSEAFPLFAMASTKNGGLGLDETDIGIVQTIAGSVFVLGQYPTFTFVKKRFGLMKALKIGALCSNLFLVFMPLGLYFSPTNNNSSNHNHNWYELGYLGLVSGAIGIFGSIFMGCATIGVNGCIEHPSQRASMNGLQSMVASIGRGLGPIVSGYLVASAMTSEVISSQASAWVVYGFLVLIGMATYISTRSIPVEGNNR